jgi:hypothetical protein
MRQLNRTLIPVKQNKRFVFNAVLFFFLLKSSVSCSQCRAVRMLDTIQMFQNNSKIKDTVKHDDSTMLDELSVIAYGNSKKRFGTGNIVTIDKYGRITKTTNYKRYGFYWKKIHITLFKRKIKN